jgi:hypothetical protein
MDGDTLIDNISYKKIYYQNVDLKFDFEFIGGIREDSAKQIFFYPTSTYIDHPTGGLSFPHDTAEQLLYTFNNLSAGMILPINVENVTIEIAGIDSILLGDHYRKRYHIERSEILGDEYWIEGIGSTKELFMAFSHEFEWTYYTLCFEDTSTYYINVPYGGDSCHYSIPIGVDDHSKVAFSVYPNPATSTISIEGQNQSQKHIIEIYNSLGSQVLISFIGKGKTTIDIFDLPVGLYYIKLITGQETYYSKLIKDINT